MIWSFLLASILLTLMPGPDILFVLTQSIGRGVRAAFAVALGLCSGLIFHTAAVAAGVAIILAGSPTLFTVLKYGGAAYLTWLGVKAILATYKKEPEQPKAAPADLKRSYWGLYRQGITMNLLNPKVVLFFLSFLPGFVPDGVESQAWYVVMLGAIFAAQALVVFSTVAVLGNWLSRMLRIDRYVHSRAFAYLTAAIYVAIAVMIVI